MVLVVAIDTVLDMVLVLHMNVIYDENYNESLLDPKKKYTLPRLAFYGRIDNNPLYKFLNVVNKLLDNETERTEKVMMSVLAVSDNILKRAAQVILSLFRKRKGRELK